MFEKEKKTLENSLKMYEDTIAKMLDCNVKPETIDAVREMKHQVEEELMVLKTGNLALLKYNSKNYAPYTRNRFVVDFGVDEIKEYFIEGVFYSQQLQITFRNSEDFFVPEYFEKNKDFDKIRVFLLNPVGEKKAVIEFEGVSLDTITTDDFNYKSSEVLKTHVSFNFKSVTHKTL